jgi:biotin transporter BioY
MWLACIVQGAACAVNRNSLLPKGDCVLYIVAIAWLYVVMMMALAERSFAAGVGTFFFYGVLPLSVVLYLLATPARRRAQRARQQARQTDAAASDTPPDDRA